MSCKIAVCLLSEACMSAVRPNYTHMERHTYNSKERKKTERERTTIEKEEKKRSLERGKTKEECIEQMCESASDERTGKLSKFCEEACTSPTHSFPPTYMLSTTHKCASFCDFHSLTLSLSLSLTLLLASLSAPASRRSCTIAV